MQNTWTRAELTLTKDRRERPGTVSAFLSYDLGCWLFGVRVENDPCWYDVYLYAGPIHLSIVYWREPYFRDAT